MGIPAVWSRKKKPGLFLLGELTRLITNLIDGVSIRRLFAKSPVIQAVSNAEACTCGGSLVVLKTRKKCIITLDVGKVHVIETIKRCSLCSKNYFAEDLQKIVPRGCQFGFDVMEHVGKSLFVQCNTVREVCGELKAKNVSISPREVSWLGKQFIIYLALAHKESHLQIAKLFESQGGYGLHIDGTNEDGSPHLFSALDEITQIILGSIKVPSEKTETLIPFLESLKHTYGSPLFVMSDLSAAILAAIESVFPGVIVLVCHFHFLRDIGKDLLGYEYGRLRDLMRLYTTCSSLRKLAKDTLEDIKGDKILIKELKNYLKDRSQDVSQAVFSYVLTQWILEYESESNGYGFPFDKPILVFYDRLSDARAFLANLPEDKQQESRIVQLKHILDLILGDDAFVKHFPQLKKKATDFEKLRSAMRIAEPEGKHGLNDDGNDVDMSTIKARVTTFVNSKHIQGKAAIDIDYHKMVKQINKYESKLFADPIEVVTNQGKKPIQPQRTNNMMERMFREEHRNHCKRSGCSSLKRQLQTMLADTPLIQNLSSPKYLEMLLNGKKTLAQRFAEIDRKLVNITLKEAGNAEDKLPPLLRKVLHDPNFSPLRVAG